MQIPEKRPAPGSAYLLIILTMLLWAGNHVVGRWATGNIPPMTLAFLRWALAAVLILPIARSSLVAESRIIRANLPRLVLLGVLGSGSYNTLQYIALTETTVSNGAILNSWAPLLIAAAGTLIYGDPLRREQMSGLGLSFLGVLTILLRGNPANLAALDFNHGDLVMLVATGVWALYTTQLRNRPPVSTLSFAAITYGVAGIVNLPLAAWEHAHGLHIKWSPLAAGAIFYAGALASLVAYYLYARSVEVIGATRTGAFIHMIPLFASLMAMVLIGESPSLYHAAGFVLILSGVWLANR